MRMRLVYRSKAICMIQASYQVKLTAPIITISQDFEQGESCNQEINAKSFRSQQVT